MHNVVSRWQSSLYSSVNILSARGCTWGASGVKYWWKYFLSSSTKQRARISSAVYWQMYRCLLYVLACGLLLWSLMGSTGACQNSAVQVSFTNALLTGASNAHHRKSCKIQLCNSITQLIKSKRDKTDLQMMAGRSQFQEKTAATHLRVKYNLGINLQSWK